VVLGLRADMDALPIEEITVLRTPQKPGERCTLRLRRAHGHAAGRRLVEVGIPIRRTNIVQGNPLPLCPVT
jgi:hypothetical protein